MKVLVADDDAELRELIAFTLSQAGYLVIKAGDGSAAVRLFAAEARFSAGAASPSALPPEGLPEIAFVGRSNVGKSSLVNALTGRRMLARISNTPGRTRQINFFDLDTRLKTMDSQAIDMEVLSINPFWYDKDRDLAAKIVQTQNEKLAEFTAAHRERFAAFASLTLHDPQLARRSVIHRHPAGAGIGGDLSVPVAAFTFAHGGPQIDSPPPALGQHNDEVFGELGEVRRSADTAAAR